MIETRPINPQDRSFLYELYASTRFEEVSMWGWDEKTVDAFLNMQWTAQTRSYQMQYPQMRQLIVLYEHVPVGRLLTCSGDQACLLVDISLLPSYRRQGIGKALIERLKTQTAQEHKPVHLHVSKGNPAKQLYERLGFRVIGDNGLYEQMEWRDSPG